MMTDWDCNYEAMEEPNMTIPWEAGKEYTLQNGWRYRVYATDGAYPFSIHGAYWHPYNTAWIHLDLNGDGKYPVNSDFDLLPERVKGDWWILITNDLGAMVYESKDEASQDAKYFGAKAVVHVTYDVEEGEGL